MNLKTLKIKNFRGYGQSNLEGGYYTFEDLDQGLIVLSGFNGFGKTSFYEAIEWCLTDSIIRLNELRSRKIYTANTLKQSEYLKFISPMDSKRDRDNRSAEVELEFDNGYIIRRDTRSHFISVSENDRYESTLHIYDGSKWSNYLCKSEEPGNDSEKLIACLFLNQHFSDWKDQLFQAHFLGQEGMNQFLRSCPPDRRRSILMKLLNLSPLEQIFDISEQVKSSQRLNNKIRDMGNIVRDFDDHSREIIEVFTAREWGTVDQYILSIREEFTALKQKSTEFGLGEELMLAEWEDRELIGLNNVNMVLGKVEIKKNILEKLRQDLIEDRNLVQRKKQNIEKIFFLHKRVLLQEQSDQIERLFSMNFENILRESDHLNDSINSLGIKAKALNDKNNKLPDYVQPLQVEWAALIDTQLKRIHEDFWSTYNTYFTQYPSFIELYKEEINNPIEEWTQPLVDIVQLQNEYQKREMERNELQKELQTKRASYSSVADLNESYLKVLDQMKSYILNNSEIVDSCPVCLNSDFSEGKYQTILNNFTSEALVPDYLLGIIEHTMSSGNDKLLQMGENITGLERRLVECDQYIADVITIPLTDSITRYLQGFRSVQQNVGMVLSERITLLQSQIHDASTKYQDFEKQMSNYAELYLICTKSQLLDDGKEIRNIKLSELRTKLKEELVDWDKVQAEHGYFDISPSIEEVKETVSLLQEGQHDIDEVLSISEFENRIRLIQSKNEQINLLIPMFEKLLTYKPGDVEQKLLRDYVTAADMKESTVNIVGELIKYKDDAIKIHQIAADVQQQALGRHLENNKLINWIFKLIFPHPYFRDVVISGDRNGVNVKNDTGVVLLDQIFSSAQLNILALSIFLGLGLTQRFSNWDQLFLDDPIQSMDDIKILSFIDVLRAICDSREKRRNLIISTHDDNFAKLLAIKFRNKPFKHYNFTGYGPQGPLVESN